MCILAVSACSAPRDGQAGQRLSGGEPDIVVASFNFAESELLAEIYAAALEGAGLDVRRELRLGPRELVAPALVQGHVDLVPEYLGSALPGLGEPASRVALLTPAPAQNQNAVVVTRTLAERLGLRRVSDLTAHSDLVLGGPAECPERDACLRGLQHRYGLTFERFVALDGASRAARGLSEGVVDVAVMFTTDGELATRDLVVLEDDRHLQPPENVVPAVRRDVVERYGDRVVGTLDRVSAELTTTTLRLMNWRVSIGGRSPQTEARAWLIRRGLIGR